MVETSKLRAYDQRASGHKVEDSVDSSSTTSDDETCDNVPFKPASAATSARRLSIESRENNAQSTAACLPSELLLEIFKFLPSANDLYSTLLTCQSWCECSVEMLWYKPMLYRKSALDKLISAIWRPAMTFEYSMFIRRLNLSYLVDHIDDNTLLKLHSCRNLERVTLSNCTKVTDRGLCDVLARNKGLVALDVTNLDFITDLSVLVAASRNKSLQGLNLSGCTKITDDAVTNIATSCKYLRRVSIKVMHTDHN